MNVQKIGEDAGIVWRLLYGDHRKWEYREVKGKTHLPDRELNAAIGWLAREGKIQFDTAQVGDKQYLYLELNYFIG